MIIVHWLTMKMDIMLILEEVPPEYLLMEQLQINIVQDCQCILSLQIQ